MRSSRRIRAFGSIWIVFLGMAFVGMLGLAVDLAYLSLCTEQAQNVADATAFAGAWGLRHSQNAGGSLTAQTQSAFNASQATAQANTIGGQSVNVLNTDIVVGHFYRQGDPTTRPGFYSAPSPYANPYNAIQATAQRTNAINGPVPLMFGGIFGLASQSLTASAVALSTAGSAPGILILDPTSSSTLNITSTNASLTSQNGPIVVNSSSSTAFMASGTVSITASEIDIVGSYKGLGSVSLPTVKTGQKALADPLAALPAPAATGTAGTVSNKIYQPGYFSSGIHLSGSGTYTFQPGIYVIDNGLAATGTLALTGTNVTFIVRTGSVSLTGSGGMSFSPPASGTYSGVTVFQLPADTSAASLTGTSGTSITGALYFPGACLSLTGASSNFSNQIIAYQLHLTSGTPSIVVAAGTRFGAASNICLVQ